MTIDIKPLEQTDKYEKLLAYGVPGTGKTHFAGSFPKPMLYCECDPGGRDTLIGISGIDLVEVTQFDELGEVYQILKKADKYKTLVIDSLTTLQFPLMDEVSKKSKVPGINWAPDQTGWGEILARYRRLIMHLKQIPIHIVYTALSTVDTEETSQRKMIMPDLKGAARGLIGALVSDVGYTYMEGEEWFISFKPNSKYLAKRRVRDITKDTKLIFSNPKFEDLME